MPGESTISASSSTASVSYPSSLSPAPPDVPRSPHPVKVLVVGDSIAGTLAVGLDDVARSANVQIVDEGLPGCSVSNTEQIKVLFYVASSGPPCDSANPDAIFATWRHWVDTYNPDVVLYAARSQTFDQQVGGKWEHIGQASFDGYLTGRFRRAVEVLGSKGATVVFMTSPYYDSGTESSGTPWPEDAPARVDLDNATIRQLATSSTAAGGGRVYVFNLNSVVSPDGRYSAAVGAGERALQRRRPLHDLGRDLRGAAPGARSRCPGPGPRHGLTRRRLGRVPPSTPSWYAAAMLNAEADPAAAR